MKTLNCPQCGDALNIYFKYSKLTSCPSCKSTLLLDDEAVSKFGEMNLLDAEQTLLKMHKPFSYEGLTFTPIGKIRYAYLLGFWEEWFVIDKGGKGFWISVDEGDFVKEEPLELETSLIQELMEKTYLSNTVSIQNKKYLISEKDQGICQGFEGEIPRSIQVGEVLQYLHLTALKGSEHITLEFEDGKYSAYKGQWLDAYDIEIEDV